MNRNYATIAVTLLGAIKLALNGFGYDLISDTQINDIANGISAVLAVAGVIMTHIKKPSIAPAAPADTNVTPK